MDDYKPNSHRSKEELPKTPEKRVIDKVVSNTTKQKKKTEARKFIDVFIQEDLRSIGSYILTDVVVPAIKRTILDSVKAILGETGTSRSSTSATKISYRSFYDKEADKKTPYNMAQTRAGFDYDEIVFESRGDAEAVLDAMNDIVNSQYGIVSVGDLYDLANITTDNYTVNNYGWTDIRGSKVVPTRDGYMLKLPRALPLK